ncbi:MAG TPA: hypothetical protein VMW75_10140 [Thermoanaerobaculia bacterium]|nr:hypothetical protein [Thermoanaerobaculia bacterium]
MRTTRDRRTGTTCTPFLLAALLAALLLPVHAGAAAAGTCHQETVPAATLLLPYFELDTYDPNGLTTLFSINNASAVAVLAHVAIWSDLGVPILNFNVYLTGYDVQTINLRDVIIYGQLPQTASAGQDPDDVISPKGSFSQDIAFASCQGQLPPPPLSASALSSVQRALTGLSSPMLKDLCAGQAIGDLIARGYITVDTVSNCTVRFPGDAGYFGPTKSADATDQNVLWGSWYIINAAQGYAQGSDMVAVVADATSPETTTPGSYTFYGRYVGWSAADHRAPLATAFAAQFASGGPFDAGTDLLIWRDTKFAQGPFSCPPGSQNPAWYPLGQEALVVFDEQEHPQVPPVCPFGSGSQPSVTPYQCPPMQSLMIAPAAAQRTRVGGAYFPVPFTFGWVFLDFNWSDYPTVGPNPPADPAAAQAWVIATQSSRSHFAVALDAYRLDSACSANHFVP